MAGISASNNFLSELIGKLIAKMLEKKLGYRPKLTLNSVDVQTGNKISHIHLDIDVDIKTSDISGMFDSFVNDDTDRRLRKLENDVAYIRATLNRN